MKKIILCLFLSLFLIDTNVLKAQDVKEEVKHGTLDISVDMVNRYVWRGLLFCDKPSIQPYIAYTNAKQNFSFGAWGSYSNSTNYGEVDLFMSYSAKYFTLSVWDYFLMDETAPKNKYFIYDNNTTGHSFEASLVLGNFKVPVQITSSVFFYGADKDLEGNNNYSLYFEAAYNFNIANQDLNVFVGGTPSEGLYGTGAGVVNVGCSMVKEIKVSDNFIIPLKGSIVFNPREENAYFIVGITL